MRQRSPCKISRKVKKGKYTDAQLWPYLSLCLLDHTYGALELLGPASIPGKICTRCSHIIYKDEVVLRREKIRENLKKIKVHIDLFHD